MIVTEILPVRTEQYKPPVNLTEQKKVTLLDWYRPREESPILLHTYEHAKISPYGVVFHNFKIVRDSVYPMVQQNRSFTFLKKTLVGKVRKVDRPCLVFHHVWYDNYYHWMTECLPRLFLMKDKLKHYTLILPSKLSGFHQESLALFEFDNYVVVHEDELIQARQVSFPSFLSNRFGIHHNRVTVEMFHYIKEKLGYHQISGNRKIYATRKRPTKRKCLNEKDVIGIFSNSGFEIYEPEDFSFKNQVKYFSEAKCTAGVHGSAFVNGVFMTEGGKILDFMEENHDDLCYSNLLSLFGINYFVLLSKGVGLPSNFRNNDLRVNINDLERILEDVLWA